MIEKISNAPGNEGARSERVVWPVLVAGAVLALVLSLSVHAGMLQGLHIPYPAEFPRGGWPQVPDGVLSAGGAIYLAAHLPGRLRARSFAVRWGVLFLLLATVREVFFRAPFMNFINLSAFPLWTFVDNVPKLLPLLVVAAGAAAWRAQPRSTARWLAMAVVLAVAAGLVVAPLGREAFAGVLPWTAAREGHERYGLPYDWHILLPAYLTFAEPVISALVIGYLVRGQLPRGAAARFWRTACLILALKGPVFAPLLNIGYAHSGPVTAVLSYGQFTLETVTLAVLTAATLQVGVRRSANL